MLRIVIIYVRLIARVAVRETNRISVNGRN